MLFSLYMLLWVPMFVQTTEPDGSVRSGSIKKQIALNNVEQKDSILLSRLVNTRIILTDGSIKKNCKVKEIHEYWLVYEKDGSLHDQLIEKIKRIEIGDGTKQAVFFDEKNQPVIVIIN